jgi:hypothetical protein
MSRILILAALSVATGPALAATFVVTRFDDPLPNGCLVGDCSLREATIAANAAAGADMVQLSTGTYQLTRLAAGDTNNEAVGSIYAKSDIEFVGAGSAIGQTLVRWSASVTADAPVFKAYGAGTPLQVAWTGMRISHGVSGSSIGGCMYLPSTYSNYTLDDVVVRSCTGNHGGAIYTSQSTLTLIDSVIEYNTSSTSGGGIALSYDSTLITQNARIRNNTATYDGGGVSFSQHYLTAPNLAYWFDEGGSSVTNNHAARNGGGLSVAGDLWLEVDGRDNPAYKMLRFSGNTAATAGGGISRGARFVNPGAATGLTLTEVDVRANSAPRGGGIDAVQQVSFDTVHIYDNASTYGGTTGHGGGLYLDVGVGSNLVARSSFTQNEAVGMHGGAIHNRGCAPLTLENLSIQHNVAKAGAALTTHGNVELRHVTAIDNTGSSALHRVPSSSCGSPVLTLANSLLGDGCSSGVTSAGGNQYGPDASACPLTANDQLQTTDATFALSHATFGGPFQVMGWNADALTRPQRDFGLAANCVATDVRGLPRSDGFCDSGAFEQQ